MRRNPRPPIRRSVKPSEVLIIPFFTPSIDKGDLFRFAVSQLMTLMEVHVDIEVMHGGPYILCVEVQSKQRKISVSEPVAQGANDIKFPSVRLRLGDVIVVNFDPLDKPGVVENVFNISITLRATR